MRLRQDADLPSVVLVGAAWFWVARMAGGALLALGSGPGAAHALAWLGVAGAGWTLAPSAAAGTWGRVVGAALLIALPEAIVVVSGRLTSAAVLGLKAPFPSLVRDGGERVLLAAAPLVVAAVLFLVVPRALTSAGRRSPT